MKTSLRSRLFLLASLVFFVSIESYAHNEVSSEAPLWKLESGQLRIKKDIALGYPNIRYPNGFNRRLFLNNGYEVDIVFSFETHCELKFDTGLSLIPNEAAFQMTQVEGSAEKVRWKLEGLTANVANRVTGELMCSAGLMVKTLRARHLHYNLGKEWVQVSF